MRGKPNGLIWSLNVANTRPTTIIPFEFSTKLQFCFRNVVKSFYTAGMLFDVLTNFGELAEEVRATFSIYTST